MKVEEYCKQKCYNRKQSENLIWNIKEIAREIKKGTFILIKEDYSKSIYNLILQELE